MSIMYQPKRHFSKEDIQKELLELYSQETSDELPITEEMMTMRSQLEYNMHHDAVDIVVTNGDELENFFESEKRNFYDEYIEVFESAIEKAMEDVFGYWHTVTRVEENSVKPFEVKLTKVVDGYVTSINIEGKVDRDEN